MDNKDPNINELSSAGAAPGAGGAHLFSDSATELDLFAAANVAGPEAAAQETSQSKVARDQGGGGDAPAQPGAPEAQVAGRAAQGSHSGGDYPADGVSGAEGGRSAGGAADGTEGGAATLPESVSAEEFLELVAHGDFFGEAAESQAQGQPTFPRTKSRTQLTSFDTPVPKLVPAQHEAPNLVWNDTERAIFGAQGLWRVTGPSGSGVSSVILAAAHRALLDGADPSALAIISPTKESAQGLRERLSAMILSDPELQALTTKWPMVRSVHALAFAILDEAARRRPGDPRPKLMTGAEQDAAMRAYLAEEASGDRGMNPVEWPARIQPALTFVSFARGLRDLLLRAAERGVSGAVLEELGREHSQDMWVAAGQFLQKWNQTLSIAGTTSLNASELVSAALTALERDPELGEVLAKRYRFFAVDDAQNLDPLSAQLLGRFVRSADQGIIGGNIDAAVFHFRGANTAFLQDTEVDRELVLGESCRKPHQREALLAYSAGEHGEVIANRLRRSHLIDQVPWKDMAVVVRDSSGIEPIRRALIAAGVPVYIDPSAVVLSEQPIIGSLMLLLKATTTRLSSDEVRDLITGPLGGTDAIALRRMLREVVTWQRTIALDDPATAGMSPYEILAAIIDPKGAWRIEDVFAGARAENEEAAGADADGEAAANEGAPKVAPGVEQVHRSMRRLVAAAAEGAQAIAEYATVEMIVWKVWDATQAATRLVQRSLAGGAPGSQADRELDTVMAFFDLAGEMSALNPEQTIADFIEDVRAQELPTGTRPRRGVTPDAVSLLSAHAIVGQEWDVVVVAGVQEGSWPSLTVTGTLFGQEKLVDLLDHGISPATPIARTFERLQEEQRLFDLAVSRAKRSLLVTAVDSESGEDVSEPSRFFRALEAELEQESREAAGAAGATPVQGHGPQASRNRHVLSLPHVIAELRRAAADFSSPEQAQAAAYQLARLAEAGIYGAAPGDWWGISRPEFNQSYYDGSDTITLSPSRLGKLLDCPLKAALNHIVEEEEPSLPLLIGNLLHAYTQAVAEHLPSDAVANLTGELLRALITDPVWQADQKVAALEEGYGKVAPFIAANDSTYLGSEVSFTVPLGDIAGFDGKSRKVKLNGRIDRLDAENGKEAPKAAEFRKLKPVNLAPVYAQLPDSVLRVLAQGDAAQKTDKLNTNADLLLELIAGIQREISGEEPARGQVDATGVAENDDEMDYVAGGTYKAYDYKSSSSALTAPEAAKNIQLKAYNFALRHSYWDDNMIVPRSNLDHISNVGVSSLIYPLHSNAKVTLRNSALMTDYQDVLFRAQTLASARLLTAHKFKATPSEAACKNCPLVSVCPAQEQGLAVTELV